MTELPHQFRWASPLGVAAALFLSYALLCAAIGIAGPIYLRSGHPSLRDSLFLPAAAGRTSVSLWQLHPFAWYPALAVPLATALGWWGMKQ